MVKIKGNSMRLMVPAFVIWSAYSCIYLLLVKSKSTLMAGIFAFSGQAGLDIVASILTFKLYLATNDSKTKIIYFMFFVSFISAMFADGIYNFAMNILDIKYFSDINSFFEIPFLFFLLFQVIAWGMVFFMKNSELENESTYLYLPYTLVSTLIFFMFLFGIHWKIEYFSLLGVYQLMDTLLEVVGFTLATVSLTRAKDTTIRFASIGYLIVISSDLLIRYHVVSGLIPFLDPFETTWVLGLLLLTTSFFFGKKNQLKLLPLNSLESHVAIWVLNIFLFFILFFLSIAFVLDQNIDSYLSNINKNLLPIIIPFVIFSIIISKILSAKIASPLKNIENMIRAFSNDDSFDIPREAQKYTHILEFITLEKFVHESFNLHKKKHHFQMEFAKLATQVAHDIKSPMIALNNYFKEYGKIDDSTKDIIDESLNRINNIANTLLMQHKNINKPIDNSKNSIEVIYPLLESIIFEKKIQYKDYPIDIHLVKNKSIVFHAALINRESFDRVISNLINNAVESINGNGSVTILLKKNVNNVIIEVKDSGCGMPEQILKKIENAGSIGKENGNGLGLPHAFKSIHEWGATYKIESKKNIGTKFSIILPLQAYPDWIQTEIYFIEEQNIIIVADDSILDLWKKKFIANNKIIDSNVVSYLENVEELEYYIESRLGDLKNTIFLIDFHLISSSQSGIKLITRLPVDNECILLCSRYPDHFMKEKIEKNNLKFILKNHISQINLIKIYQNPDLILLDDKKFITKIWQIEGDKFNKKIIAFNKTDLFLKYINFFNKEIDVYLDSNLGGESGEYLARNLYDKGFYNLYITTGYDPEIFKNMPWIKGIIGKEPPFSKNYMSTRK